MKQQREEMRFLLGILFVAAVCQLMAAQTDPSTGNALVEHNPRLRDFPVMACRSSYGAERSPRCRGCSNICLN